MILADDKLHQKAHSQNIAEGEHNKDVRYIVRVVNKDLNGNLSIAHALWNIKGIGQRTGNLFAIAFEKQTGISRKSKLGEIPEDKVEILEKIIMNPVNYGIPKWAINRPDDFELGIPRHLVMNDLDFALRNDILRLGEMKSYRGLRLQWGLTVRGQRTKSTHRGKGGVVGVTKKDIEAKSAPKSAAAPVKDAPKGAKK